MMSGEGCWIIYPIINSVNADVRKNGGRRVLVIKGITFNHFLPCLLNMVDSEDSASCNKSGKQCNTRMTSLFKKIMPVKEEGSICLNVGVEHHSSRVDDVFGRLDSVKPSVPISKTLKQENSDEDRWAHDKWETESKQGTTPGKDTNYLSSNNTATSRYQKSSQPSRKDPQSNRTNHRGPRERAGFVRVELGLKRNDQVSQESVIDFLNEVRTRKGKPALDGSTERPMLHTTRNIKPTVKTTQKRKASVAPSSSLRLDHLEEQFSPSIGGTAQLKSGEDEGRDEVGVSKPVVAFRAVKIRKQSHQRSRNNHDDSDGSGE
jgi:hypothetical protein